MKKALVVIAVLLALGGGIFFFLKTVSPEPKGTVLKNRPAHLRNVEKGTVFKADAQSIADLEFIFCGGSRIHRHLIHTVFSPYCHESGKYKNALDKQHGGGGSQYFTVQKQQAGIEYHVSKTHPAEETAPFMGLQHTVQHGIPAGGI